ncbi:MAG: glucose-1-phosphate thymidylyltransferase RfbA [Clostridiales bacterium]|nr:glucose-1-phosphate thymidylyltransferase RfbA [Clostridiales bacterium]
MKGIILSAGKGSRLYPATKPVCKPLIPLYDKPLIYYPLDVLLRAGITEILIIVPPDLQQPFEQLFGDGSGLGISISYIEQKVQRGIADAFLVGTDFIGRDDVCLVLGDNVFYGPGLDDSLMRARENNTGATVFGYYVDDPRPFGVVEFDEDGKVLSIEEKPANPRSNYIVPGLYFYDNRVVEIAQSIKPSERGELEITSVNNEYLRQGMLNVVKFGREFFWADAGNADNLLGAANTIRVLQGYTGSVIACVEETAYRHGYIDRDKLLEAGMGMKSTEYGKYILSL